MTVDHDAANEEQARQFLEEFAAATQPVESEFLAELFRAYSTGEPTRVLELSRQLEEVYSARKAFGSLTRWLDQVKEPMLRRRVASLRQRFLDFQGDRDLRKQLVAKVHEVLNTDAPDPEAPLSSEGLRQALPYRHPVDCADPGLPTLREPMGERRRAEFERLRGASVRRAGLMAGVFALRARLSDERNAEGGLEFDPEQHILQEIRDVRPRP